jgi:hypothetical protein
MITKTRKVFNCEDCGYSWHSPFYEPTWIGKRIAERNHAKRHDALLSLWDNSTAAWIAHGSELETKRIIELLETHCEEKHLAICDDSSCYDLIALIKGENK